MHILLNGEPREVADGATLAQLLETLGLENRLEVIHDEGLLAGWVRRVDANQVRKMCQGLLAHEWDRVHRDVLAADVVAVGLGNPMPGLVPCASGICGAWLIGSGIRRA